MNDILFSHNSDEWATPLDLFIKLDYEFNFTLDPCATFENKKCINYFDKSCNGLLKSWCNNVVFCNPPYSEIKLWVKKCYEEWKNNHITIVLLIPSRTDTSYFHDYIYPFCELRFIRGRLRFNGSKNNAPFPSVLCIYRGV